MKLVKLECEHCGATLEVDMERGEACCPYCGSKLMLDKETIQSMQETKREQIIQEEYTKRAEMEYAFRNSSMNITKYVLKGFAVFFFGIFGFILLTMLKIAFF